MMSASRRPVLALALLAALSVATSGCFNPFQPLVSSQTTVIEPAPVPSTARLVVLLFKWCWENRDISKYREIFTDDYQFAFAVTDSAGNPYRSIPWTREDELISAANLFQGGSAGEPAASSITLIFNGDLTAQHDFRPGKTWPWHQQILITNLTLTINKTDGSATRVTGGALFYLVRGDSAAIPKELIDRGFRPDSTRWYIERWEDQTNTGGAAALRPAGPAEGRGPAASAGGLGIGTPLPEVGDEALLAPAFPQPRTWGQVKVDWR